MVYGVFELPLPRNAQKRTKKKVKKKSRMVGGGARRFFLSAPRPKTAIRTQGKLALDFPLVPV
jgi:hypothetical protein